MKKGLKVVLPLLLLAVLIIFGAKTARADEYVPIKTITNSGVPKPAYSGWLPVGYEENGLMPYYVTATATGKMWLDVKAAETNEYSVTAVLGIDGGDYISYNSGYYGYVSPGTTKTALGCLDVVKGETYCVGVSSYDRNAMVQVRTYIYSYANNRTLSASSSTFTLASGAIKSGESNVNTTLYYKVTPTKTGVMTVTLKEYGYTSSDGYITLLNSSKKAISEKIYYSSSNASYKVRFGVKKGATYYLKVESTNGSQAECFRYGIRYTVSAATDRSLGSKSAAKTLKRKATATSTLFIAKSGTETDWYKFKVTSKRKTVFNVDLTNMRGSDAHVTVVVYKGSKKFYTTTLTPGKSWNITLTYGTTYGKANAGTYYVKVTKSAKLSGQYKIKYVQ